MNSADRPAEQLQARRAAQSSWGFSSMRSLLAPVVLVSLFVIHPSPVSAVPIWEHDLTFNGVTRNFPLAGQSTWYYTVTSSGTKAISHPVFEINLACLQVLDAGTWGPEYTNLNPDGGSPVLSQDPTTALTGLKFEQPFAAGGTRKYYFTVNNTDVEQTITVGIKAGQRVDYGTTTGPSCTGTGQGVAAVRPILECVVENGPNDFTAHFGYRNDNSVPVEIQVGVPRNRFSPDPYNRGQPQEFQPGRTPYFPNAAFSVDFNGSNLVWTLTDLAGSTRTSTASSASQRCQAQTCGNGIVEGTEQCDDGNTADGDCCSSTCQFESGGSGCADDGNVCTNDQCNGSGTCAHPNNTAPCTDGLYCNGTDTCSGGSCSVHAGDPCAGGPECNDACNETADNCLVTAGTGCADDGNVCTDDQCDGAGSCTHQDNTAPCDDGQFCTVTDVCSGGLCNGGARDCSGGSDQCNIGVCNEGTDACEPQAAKEGQGCDDELFCTVNDVCGGGVCSGAARECVDTNTCTRDVCNEAADQCQHWLASDIVFVLDGSFSMNGELKALQGHQAGALPERLARSGVDYRVAIVRYGVSDKVTGLRGPELLLNFTDDAALFRSVIAERLHEPSQRGNKAESGTQALDFALDNLTFRPTAERVFILLTDEDDDLPDLDLRGRPVDPPPNWLLSATTREVFQARLDATAQRLIANRVLLFMMVRPWDKPSVFQYGSPEVTRLKANGEFDVAATLAQLVTGQKDQSLQGQLLAEGRCTAGLCTEGRGGVSCTEDSDCGLVSRAYNIRSVEYRGLGRCSSLDFWKDLSSAVVRDADCGGFEPPFDPNDVDGDGQANGGDPCSLMTPEALPSCPVDQVVKDARVRLYGLALAPGKQGMIAKGYFNPAALTPAVDPGTYGGHFRLEDALGVLYDVSIPGGLMPAGHCGPLDGWRPPYVRSDGGREWVYRNLTGKLPPACLAGSAQGIFRVKVRDLRATQRNAFEFTVQSRYSTLPHAPEYPVSMMKMDFALGAQLAPGVASAQAIGGQCAEAVLLSPGQSRWVFGNFCTRVPGNGTIGQICCEGM